VIDHSVACPPITGSSRSMPHSVVVNYSRDTSDHFHVFAFVPRLVGDLFEHPHPTLLERPSVRPIPKPARGDPPSKWPTPFRDFATANPFAVLTPHNNALIDGAMSWEPDSIDADADGFVQSVWSTTRRVVAVSYTTRKGPGLVLQRSIVGAIARRRHASFALCQKARGSHPSVALNRYIGARFMVKHGPN
jgi:hypothetical protein